jgi:hypothetical protein
VINLVFVFLFRRGILHSPSIWHNSASPLYDTLPQFGGKCAGSCIDAVKAKMERRYCNLPAGNALDSC